MEKTPAVSVVTPTRGRAGFVRQRYEELLAQSFPDWEWLIFEDGGPRDPFLDRIASPRIRYIHSADGFTVGEKRNVLADLAKAPVIVHMDDDDHYAPAYLATMLGQMADGVDLVNLSAWFLYDIRHAAFGYWDCRVAGVVHQRWARSGIDLIKAPDDPAWPETNRLGFGFSYAYRKAFWQRSPFQPLSAGEDLPFARAASAAGTYRDFPDERGLCLHILHGGNTSLCYPQYRLPAFLLDRFFGAAGRAAVAGA